MGIDNNNDTGRKSSKAEVSNATVKKRKSENSIDRKSILQDGKKKTDTRVSGSSRPNGGSRANGSSRPSGSSRSGRNDARSGGKKRRRMTVGTLGIMLAVVVGILIALIINGVMRRKYLKVTQIENEYALGSTFDINTFFAPENKNARLYFDSSTFHPENVGEYKIKFTVRCGRLKKTMHEKINIVDVDSPMINGPDKLPVFVGEEIRLGDYYEIIDSQPGLEENILVDERIDTSKVGFQDITMRVIDWCNNSSSKKISVAIYDLDEKMTAAAKAVREYNREFKHQTTEKSVYMYVPKDDKEVDYYILIGNSYIFRIDKQGICSCVEIEDQEEESKLKAVITESGEWYSITNLSEFNYYAN